jgi:RNA polymerase sigma-32 factor
LAEITMATKTLPALAGGSLGLSRYLDQIRRFPMLEPGQEFMPPKRW